MSIHYFIDPFTLGPDIIDVNSAPTGSSDSTGSSVIRVPDGVAIHNDPGDLPSLLNSKYEGLLASYAGFPEIVADPCLDALTVDPVATSKAFLSSGLVNHSLNVNGSVLRSTVIPLALAPTQAVLVWEEYTFVDLDAKTGRMRRTYTEASGANLLCSASFNGGANFNTIVNGGVLNIPIPHQGSSFQISLTNNSASRIYLGSWAVIY